MAHKHSWRVATWLNRIQLLTQLVHCMGSTSEEMDVFLYYWEDDEAAERPRHVGTRGRASAPVTLKNWRLRRTEELCIQLRSNGFQIRSQKKNPGIQWNPYSLMSSNCLADRNFSRGWSGHGIGISIRVADKPGLGILQQVNFPEITTSRWEMSND